jgi:hypothetical protein
MCQPRTGFLHLLTWLILCASLHVQGYTIAPSCQKYGPPGSEKDLSPTIKAAMLEAQKMAELGAGDTLDTIKGRFDRLDNSINQLFPWGMPRHFNTIKGTYYIPMARNNYNAHQRPENFKTMANAPWQFTEFTAETKDLVIGCGSDDFTTEFGWAWKFKATGVQFKVAKMYHKHDKWTLCPTGSFAGQIDMPKLKGYFDVLLLCDILDDKTAKGVPVLGIEDRGTLEQLYQMPKGSKGRLEEGSSFWVQSNDLNLVLSRALLHEMFHVVFKDRSK